MHPVARIAAGTSFGVVVTSKGLVVGVPGPVAYLGGIAGALYVIASWAPATQQTQPNEPAPARERVTSEEPGAHLHRNLESIQ